MISVENFVIEGILARFISRYIAFLRKVFYGKMWTFCSLFWSFPLHTNTERVKKKIHFPQIYQFLMDLCSILKLPSRQTKHRSIISTFDQIRFLAYVNQVPKLRYDLRVRLSFQHLFKGQCFPQVLCVTVTSTRFFNLDSFLALR